MRVKNENLRRRILVEARKEFATKGFKGTSMRTIAANAEVVLSNIYNYFENKDAIFVEIMHPLISQLKKLMDEHHSEEYYTIDIFFNEAYLELTTNAFVSFIEEFRNDLDLLFTKSQGSSLEHFFESIIEEFTKEGMKYMEKMRIKYPELNTDISPFFIHLVSSWVVTMLREVTIHKEMSKEDIRKFVNEYARYGTAGWKTLMKV